MSCPLSFNDAHEGVVHLTIPWELERLRRLAADDGFIADLEPLLRVNMPLTERIRLLTLAAPAIQTHLSRIDTRQFLSEVVACCLSEHPDSPLMWAHYGAAYNGVCLRFDPNRCKYLAANLEMVYYHKAPPTFEFGGPLQDLGRSVAAVKSECWTHEHEWRLISPPPARRQPIAPTALTGLIIGQSVSPEDRKSLTRAAAERSPSIAVLLARTDGYRVNIESDAARPA